MCDVESLFASNRNHHWSHASLAVLFRLEQTMANLLQRMVDIRTEEALDRAFEQEIWRQVC